MKKSIVVLIACAAFFAGATAGFLFAPVKHGIRVQIFSNNRNSSIFPGKDSKKKGKKPAKKSKPDFSPVLLKSKKR